MPRKTTVRKPGRPRKQPLDIEAEKRKVRDGMKATAERQGTINYKDAEEGLETILSEEKLKQATHAELKELRRMAERLWDKLQIEKEYEEDMEWSYGVQREATPQSEAWDKEHEFLEPKRKNAKQTKNIYTLTDKQKEKKGIALEPTPMELDVDATEAELERVLVEAELLRKQQEDRFHKGRRLTGRQKVDPTAQRKKSFWI